MSKNIQLFNQNLTSNADRLSGKSEVGNSHLDKTCKPISIRQKFALHPLIHTLLNLDLAQDIECKKSGAGTPRCSLKNV